MSILPAEMETSANVTELVWFQSASTKIGHTKGNIHGIIFITDVDV